MLWCVRHKHTAHGLGNEVLTFLATPTSTHHPCNQLLPSPSLPPSLPPSLLPFPFSFSISLFKNKLLSRFRSWSHLVQLQHELAMGCCCCRPCLSWSPLFSLHLPLFKKFSKLGRKQHLLPKQTCMEEECVCVRLSLFAV